MGYLPQNVELFSGTVCENIARMQADFKDEDVVKAAEFAGVHELVLQLPQGYQTPIGMDGSSLSGGQRQRVGFARAFYGSPRLVVLDEPNSNLDQEGEAALVQANIRAKEKGITTVIISHRPSILHIADKVMVMGDGQVHQYDERDVIFKQFAAVSGSGKENVKTITSS